MTNDIHIRWVDPRAEIRGLDTETRHAVDQVTSYAVDGAHFSPSYRMGTWDGREHTLRWSKSAEAFAFPSGLLRDVVETLKSCGRSVFVEDARPEVRLQTESFRDWRELDLRPYQKAAVEAFWQAGGRGVLKMAVRSGKTRTAGAIIARYGVRALFVVTSQLLLWQTEKALQALLPGINIGVIGDGSRTVGQVTVATVQSLGKLRAEKDPLWLEVRAVPLMVLDEIHHLVADKWRDTIMAIPARFRLGLSATVWLAEGKEERDAASVLLKAATGQVVFKVGMGELRHGNFLVPLALEMIDLPGQEDFGDEPWSQELWRAAIYENEARNTVIANRAAALAGEGRRVIVTTNRTQHVAALMGILKRITKGATRMIGADTEKNRAKKLASFRSGAAPILVSTVLSEGVDIPECDAVVVGEGGHSRVASLQRMRCLTPHPGKQGAVFVDFLDRYSPHFAGHSLARLRAYRDERAFDIRVVRPNERRARVVTKPEQEEMFR